MRGCWVLLFYTCTSCSTTGFVLEGITKCRFGEKGGNVTFNYEVNFNRLPIAEFSKDDRMFLPSKYLILEMRRVADDICLALNSRGNDMVEYMEKKEKKCNMDISEYQESTARRTVKPSMEVFLPDSFESETPSSLVCHVWGFYPSDISVSWVKNDKIVMIDTTTALPLGDWTYQVVALQDLSNSSPDDKYTCVVQHPSLDNMMMRSWRQGLTRDQITKISISSVIFTSGLLFAISGFICWKNSRRSGYTLLQGYNEVN